MALVRVGGFFICSVEAGFIFSRIDRPSLSRKCRVAAASCIDPSAQKTAPQDDNAQMLFLHLSPAYSNEFIIVSSKRTFSRCAGVKPRCTIS